MPSIISDDYLPVEGSSGGGNDPKEEKEDKAEDDSDREAKEKLGNLLSLLEQEENKERVIIPPSKEGIKFCSSDDVLCGRGGGTNLHPGNRRFRDLVDASRRAYLKARKNDKPAISRSIVTAIREMNGRFLKKDEKSGLWHEIGDDGAREKTSQALRRMAPEMRKILFEDEHRQQQVSAAIDCNGSSMMKRQQQMIMEGGPDNMSALKEKSDASGASVHPGNRRFRDLISASRRAHLNAPKSDNLQRDRGGRKLKPIIGDEDPQALRRRERDRERKRKKRRNPEFAKAEAASQALRRQRARQQQMMMMMQQGMPGMGGPGGMQGGPGAMGNMSDHHLCVKTD